MRRWWDRLFVLIILVIAGLSLYAIWPDEPDRYFPDFLNLPSGRGVPGTIAGVELPCHSADTSEDNDAANCKGMILGLDLQGGSRITLQADVQGQSDIDIASALDAAKQIIEDRVNPFGVSEASVQRAGEDRLIVELPGVSAQTAQDITRPAVLMFCEPLQETGRGGSGNPIATSDQASEVYYKPGTCEPDRDENGQVALKNPDGTIRTDEQGNIVRITPTYATAAAPGNIIWLPATGELNGAETVMTGSYLKPNSQIIFDNFNQPLLVFNMTDQGSQVFSSLTRRIQGLPLATFLDGDPIRGADGQVIAPIVEGEINDQGVTRGLSLGDAKRLRTFLNNGAFPIPLKIIQQQDVDATLGDQAVRYSVQAGLVAMAVVMGFMTLYYRLPGLLASIALVVYASVVLAIFKIGIPGSGPVTLTLAGIAAFVLSVGMAVDANILIFERTREELRNGRSLVPAVNAGFSRAWTSIRDSNVSTLITCAILYWMGDAFQSSLIKGFALTLAIGVVVSMFSAISVTRTFLRMTIATPLARWLWLWTDDTPAQRAAARAARGAAGMEAADA
jgi:preprotein translocase subunit SecD